jgi:hypothetical protein
VNISAVEMEIPLARSVTVTGDTLRVDLSDGRTISVPLGWYPRLMHATAEERRKWRLIAQGRGIHWESIDEDISVEGLIAGRASAESQVSFKKWLATRPSRLTTRSTRTRRKRRAG